MDIARENYYLEMLDNAFRNLEMVKDNSEANLLKQELLLESLAKIRILNVRADLRLERLDDTQFQSLLELRKHTTRLDFISYCALLTAVSCVVFAGIAYWSVLCGL